MTDRSRFHLPERAELTRREAQIMEILYGRGSASVAEVLSRMPNPPGYSSVRKQLDILEEKGRVRHRREGRHFVYTPVLPPAEASASALRQMVKTFFGGSTTDVVAALLDDADLKLSEEELDRIQRLAEQARLGVDAAEEAE